MKKNSILSLLVFSLFFAPIFEVKAIESVPVVQTKKSYLASLKSRLSAGIKRFKEAVRIEDVETQRIVVKELFGILRLLLIALGIGALIKYGIPFLGREVDVRGQAVSKEVDTRTKKFMEEIDKRTVSILKEMDERTKAIVKETEKQISAVTANVDTRTIAVNKMVTEQIKALTDAADVRIAKVNEEADKKIAALSKGAVGLTQQLKKELHGTSLRGLGGIEYLTIHAPTEPAVPQQPQQPLQPIEPMPAHYIGD